MGAVARRLGWGEAATVPLLWIGSRGWGQTQREWEGDARQIHASGKKDYQVFVSTTFFKGVEISLVSNVVQRGAGARASEFSFEFFIFR
jgi:hypothetical protein